MANPFEGIAKTEAWSGGGMLPVGWHKVTIDNCTTGETKKGYPQLELELVNELGSIRSWQTVTPAAMGGVKMLTDAAGLDPETLEGLGADALEVVATQLKGKKVVILIVEEPSYKDPTQMRKVVSAFADKLPEGVSEGTSNGDGKAKDDDLPF